MSLDVSLYKKRFIRYEGGEEQEENELVYARNITHNLNQMAMKAGIYEAMWRPEEIDCKLAKDIIPLLEKGLEKLKKDPSFYKQWNPENGWGSYKGLVEFTEQYLEACRQYPEATIEVDR